ncbi:hypothetical protein MYCTH_2112160 [Thermothelomyces thermophilus ATCC 42464]|uniref:Plastocyanin-like domain-containing protein n=1 Tax=Thermothelomyces thermophilus (strain ATCC 42464 / BCRC 31852 / DSM 1799) TaxID=573729 RepID=G2QKC9_THET4|nr:uncharacterized protein MYCTH_2112160 [Thermothelomyces thermophilus ATCC 42464]AEO60035.1 hypothetical protein MYCTH_2112160 [Thermothelomyces thermophilus ATCC 42464]
MTFNGTVSRPTIIADWGDDVTIHVTNNMASNGTSIHWHVARLGAAPVMQNGLINGTNSYNCTGESDVRCYLFRLINVAVDGVFEFSIDGHGLQVVDHDLVPIVPYKTDSVQLTIGQRYDVISEANAEPGSYWLRSGWNTDSPPTESESTVTLSDSCLDEPPAKTVPHLSLDVTNMCGGVVYENMNSTLAIAFRLDSPGAWLVHCHIVWHASQALALEFVESQSRIPPDDRSTWMYRKTCDSWVAWTPIWDQEESGI